MASRMDPIVFIPLTQGKVAVIDFADFELVRPFKWCANQNWNKKSYYAVTRSGNGVPNKRMHMLITGWPRVDHRNGNGLDNRRCNLRAFSQGDNLRGFISLREQRSSNYRGVTWFKQSPHKWRAQITFNYEAMSLGYFDSEEHSARAYDAAAKRLGFSEEALNFPPPRPDNFTVL